MREKIYSAIGFVVLSSLLILLSGATGDPLTFCNPAQPTQMSELLK